MSVHGESLCVYARIYNLRMSVCIKNNNAM